MRLKMWSRLLRGSTAGKAIALAALSRGVDPRTAIWRRKLTSAEIAAQVEQFGAANAG